MKRNGRSELKYKRFNLQIKAVKDDGFFSGYASVFGSVDSFGETVDPGAFKSSLAHIEERGYPLPVLWSHQHDEPIGVYERLVEDEKGLFVDGRLLVSDVARAAEIHALMKARAVSGLSIGYYPGTDKYNEKEKVLHLTEVDLQEVSPVVFPACDPARVDAVKSKLAHGELPTLPEFEKFLREAGVSRTQAAVIANRGLSHLLLQSESGSAAKQSAEKLRHLSLPSWSNIT